MALREIQGASGVLQEVSERSRGVPLSFDGDLGMYQVLKFLLNGYTAKVRKRKIEF